MNPPTTRVELDATDETLAEGLRAELHDPLWLLARQWQMGEFRGEDVGTPVLVRVAVDQDAPQMLLVGDRALSLDAAASGPIEARVEREAPAAPDLGLRLLGGMLFVELLDAAGLAAVGRRCAAALGFATSLVGNGADAVGPAEAARWPDGEVVHAATAASEHEAALRLRVVRAEDERFAGVVARWRAWYAPRRGEGGGLAWSEESWSHRATLRTRAGAELCAHEHGGGPIDWCAFDLQHGADMAPEAGEMVERVPLPVQVPGTGALRFWEMEDAQVDLGALAAGSTEIARALLSEFALLWGHDWFSVPLELPAGHWVSVREVVVGDTFGVETVLVPADAHGGFGLWRHTGGGPAARGWWVADAAPLGAGAVIERLDILRDEGANMLWAREVRWVDAFGLPVEAQPGVALPPSPTLAGWRYRPVVPPPPGWVPLVEMDGRVQPGQLALGSGIEPPMLRTPMASALALRADRLHTEGLSLLRQWEVARGRDGQLVAWIARRCEPRPPSVGTSLAFDLLERG